MLESTAAETGPPRSAPVAAALVSVAGALPPARISSAALAEGFGVSEDWIVSRTGIRERRRAGPEESLSDLAAAAGELALARAGVKATSLDLVLVATISADERTPAAAAHVAARLGAERAGAFDIAAACNGFLTGLALAAAQIESGRARAILLIGADFCSRFTDHDDKRSAPLLADGAGAVVLLATGPGPAADPDPDVKPHAVPAGGWVGPVVLASDGDHAATLATDDHGLLHMDGPEVFRHAVARMHEASLAALAAAATPLESIDLVVPHQANARITRALSERLELPAERVVDCIAELGNTSAATLPLALAHAQAEGRLTPGSRLLLTAFGAGFSWGACVLQWGGSVPRFPALSQISQLPGLAARACDRV
ncbi:MAG TPA: beta-ketoacyl-ACP synthase 3 [Solirubrobacteraceae bacterium]|nr:beta-ketoacyl-ACP synthase 3 [Solirubrobacteraceae bacterium]